MILPFAFYRVLTRRFIEPEEAGLRRLFGAEAHALSGKDPPMALDDDACAMCAVSTFYREGLIGAKAGFVLDEMA